MVDTVIKISEPFNLFHDIDGQPLEDGYIYIGQSGLDPISNPIDLFYDTGLSIPINQPLRTLGGYVVAGGTPVNVYIALGFYSITVLNKRGTLIYTDLNVQYDAQLYGSAFSSLQAAMESDLSGFNSIETISFYPGWENTTEGPKGGGLYNSDGTSGTPGTVYPDNSGFFDKNGKGFSLAVTFSIKASQFGINFDGSDSAAELQFAVNYAGNHNLICLLDIDDITINSPIVVDGAAQGALIGIGKQVTNIEVGGIGDPTVGAIQHYSSVFRMEEFRISGNSDPDNDPIGIRFFGTVAGRAPVRNIQLVGIRNWGFVFGNFFDGVMEDCEAFDCGWTPTHNAIFKAATVTWTSGSTTVTASAPIFTAGDVGKKIKAGDRGFITTVASFVSGTQITVVTAPDFTVSSDKTMFEAITISTTSGSPNATLNDSPDIDLTGRTVMISHSSNVQTTTVVTHSGTSVTLANNAIATSSNVALVTGAAIHLTAGNGGNIHGFTQEGGIGPLFSGLWAGIYCRGGKAQGSSTQGIGLVAGNLGEFETNASAYACPLYTLSGAGVITVKIRDYFFYSGASENLYLLHFSQTGSNPKCDFTIPKNINNAFKLVDPARSDTRNLILHFVGTGTGFGGVPWSYWARSEKRSGECTCILASDWTTALSVANLTPAFLFAGSVLEDIGGIKICTAQVSMPTAVFTGSDSSNYYQLTIANNPDGSGNPSNFRLYTGSPDLTAEQTYTNTKTLLCEPEISSRTKGNLLFVVIRKVGSPPALGGAALLGSVGLQWALD